MRSSKWRQIFDSFTRELLLIDRHCKSQTACRHTSKKTLFVGFTSTHILAASGGLLFTPRWIFGEKKCIWMNGCNARHKHLHATELRGVLISFSTHCEKTNPVQPMRFALLVTCPESLLQHKTWWCSWKDYIAEEESTTDSLERPSAKNLDFDHFFPVK